MLKNFVKLTFPSRENFPRSLKHLLRGTPLETTVLEVNANVQCNGKQSLRNANTTNFINTTQDSEMDCPI